MGIYYYKGLFQKAIAESAGGVKMVHPNVFLPVAAEMAEAEAVGEKFVREYLGCSSIAEARKLDAKFIEEKYIESGLHALRPSVLQQQAAFQ